MVYLRSMYQNDANRLLPLPFPDNQFAQSYCSPRGNDKRMKIKATIFALFLALSAVTSATAADIYVTSAPALGIGDCLTPATACVLDQAKLDGITVNPGDTIIIVTKAAGHTLGPLVISKDFITVKGETTLDAQTACTPASDTCITATGGYLFSIAADNVTIQDIGIQGTSGVTWAGIIVKPHTADTDKRDRWTIRKNRIEKINAKKPAAPNNVSNYSYGVYAESRETTGTATFTGNEIFDNYFEELGGLALGGANRTAGMGIYVEGITGDVTKCTTALKFACGLWVHDNTFAKLAIGQNQVNFVVDVNGKEPSVGVTVKQDANNALPNSGALIGGTAVGTDVNTYLLASAFAVAPANGLMTSAVVLDVGGSRVEETNASLGALAQVEAYVINVGRKATVNELAIAPFFKSLDPAVFGPGSDAYFATNPLALLYSSATGNIVSLSAGPGHIMTVNARAASISYKVSKDAGGNLEVRAGAQLLYDGAYRTLAIWNAGPPVPPTTFVDVIGVEKLILGGTAGNDLLTVDFDKGNPIPWGNNGIVFDGAAGFDAITIRGTAQSNYETIKMEQADKGLIMFEPVVNPGGATSLARDFYVVGNTRTIDFDNLEPIDDVVIVNTAFSVIAQNDVDAEINVINGPFKYGFKTFQINSGAVKTFEEVNFANKKHVHVYGADDTGAPGNGDDILSIFTNDADTPPLLLDVSFYGGDALLNADLSDDKFVIRPSANFPINASGGAVQADMVFLDCANTHATCLPSLVVVGGADAGGSTAALVTGFQPVTWTLMDATAATLPQNINIDKVATGWAANGAHPGDELTYTVTVVNAGLAGFSTVTTPIYVTDLIDHRLSLIAHCLTQNVTEGSCFQNSFDNVRRVQLSLHLAKNHHS